MSSKKIDRVMWDMFREYGYDRKIVQLNVFRYWSSIVKNIVGNEAIPHSLSDGGKLIVFVTNSTTKTELRMMQNQIIRSINEKMGIPIVREIQLKIRAFEPVKPIKIRVRNLPPIDLDSIDLSSEIVQKIEEKSTKATDEKLREALRALFTKASRLDQIIS